MSDGPGRWKQIVMACIIVVCASLAAYALCRSASRDDDPGAWTGRTLGFVMAGVGVLVGLGMAIYSKPGETHYCSLIFGLTVAAVLTGAYSYKPALPQAGGQAEKIPHVIKNWTGRSLPVEESTIKALRTSDIIMRNYRRGGDVVTLAVIFSVGKRRSAHPPEQCYSASGHEMEEIEYDTFRAEDSRVIECKRLIANKQKRRQAVLYWYKADTLNTASLARVSIHSIWADLMMSSGTRVALIRLTTVMQGPGDKERAFVLLKEFGRDALPEIEKALN
jgi:EpsI family protein